MTLKTKFAELVQNNLEFTYKLPWNKYLSTSALGTLTPRQAVHTE